MQINITTAYNKPLVRNSGLVLETISTSPLYTSLGIGIKCVNIIKNMATEVDNQVKGASAQHSKFTQESFRKRRDLATRLERVDADIGKCTIDAREANDLQADMQKEKAAYKRRHKNAIKKLKDECMQYKVKCTFANLWVRQ